MKKRGATLRSAKVSLLRDNQATKAEGEMLTVHDYERIRRAYYIEKKSIRQIGREMGHSYWTVRKAVDASEPEPYQLSKSKVAPVLGPYKAHIERLLAKNTRSAKEWFTKSSASSVCGTV